MQTKSISYNSNDRPNLLKKAGAVASAVVLGSLALMFSVALLTAVLTLAVIGGTYLWWKSREFRTRMEEPMRNSPHHGAGTESDVFSGEVFEREVIEGEAVRVHQPDAGVER